MQEPPNVLHQVSVLYKQQIRYIANNLYPNLLNIKTDDILRSTYLEIQSKKKNHKNRVSYCIPRWPVIHGDSSASTSLMK